ncbi:MAG: hypothetical protein ACR2FY_03485 [Pirellulaceae bacterium]
MSRGVRRLWMLLAAAAAMAALITWRLWPAAIPAEPRLSAYVDAAPELPIVFTSRSEPASLEAAAPEGEVFSWPGQALWQAAEGRLRILTPRGEVRELTWGRELPAGGTLIDVMSPTVSPDASKVIFAGRRAPPDPGHFRLYEVEITGRNLRQLTGLDGDEGCTAVPPLRYAVDGAKLSDDVRRRVDYDDVDPVYLPDGRIVFASTRVPDLGVGHARRASHLWVMEADGSKKHPITANRNNDRWPFLMQSSYLAFSLWSRNTEAITKDFQDIRRYDGGQEFATAPTDYWLGALIEPTGDRFGSLVRVSELVGRPRPLFNGRIVFMTSDRQQSRYRLVQAEPGLLTHVASAIAAGESLPRQDLQDFRRESPHLDSAGESWSLATPSPLSPGSLVYSAAPSSDVSSGPAASAYGIYSASDQWANASGLVHQKLFDDPALVDAEPVAVYPRDLQGNWRDIPAAPGTTTARLDLADGSKFDGPAGNVVNPGLTIPQMEGIRGQRTDAGNEPLFGPPPPGTIERIRIYVSARDRFDDVILPRVPGEWKLLRDFPLDKQGGINTWIPSGMPTVLAGVNAEGEIARWSTAAPDSQGKQASFFAFAGDHYSGTRAGMHHFCLGCHPGHSNPGIRGHGEK